jgi:hypothetical protein
MEDTEPRPSITPAMKVGELLEAYPELEDVLVGEAPAFANLRNPVLRRTVARVATLRQAAVIGGLEVRALVTVLRRAAGQPTEGAFRDDEADLGEAFSPVRPAWVDTGLLRGVIDADQLLARALVPLPAVAEAARALHAGEVVRVDASFRPHPLVEALAKQGFRGWVGEVGPGRFVSYFGPRPTWEATAT